METEFHFDDVFNTEDHPNYDHSSDELDSDIADEPTNMTNKMSFDHFLILKVVGAGAFGKVYQVRCQTDGKIYAMKVLKKEFLLKEKVVENVIAERQIMAKMRHPFIIKMYHAIHTPERIGFIMKFINGGQLFYHLRNEFVFSEDKAKFYIAELILAVEHLHKHHIIHRDLKPENILVSSAGHIVLTDFGFAKEDVSEENRATTACGTIEYMSPEMVRGVQYGFETDWWSVGVLLYDMIAGQPPFRHTNRKTLQNLILQKALNYPKFWTVATKSLLKGLIQRDTTKRFTLPQIKSHPFFQSINWDELQKLNISPPFIPSGDKSLGSLDVTNIDQLYTSQKLTGFSPATALTPNQNDIFQGFSYCRSISPNSSTVIRLGGSK